MKKLLLLFLLSSLSHYWAFAQTLVKIQGTVTNQKANISNVTITLYESLDSTLIAYTSTDPNGLFELKFNRKNIQYHLLARKLGFEPSAILLDSLSNIQLQNIQINLTEASVDLEEVTIKAKAPPVIIKGDTTIYNTKSYRDGTEKTIEDVLKKIPNVKISANGDITVKGKPLEKLMIEGEDFFSKNYKLISQTLDANVIDKVEEVDRYTENRLLHGIEKSDKIILNLKLDEKVKKTLFGSTTISLGAPKRYYGNVNAFSLLQKFKIGVVGSLDNTGRSSKPDIMSISTENKDAFASANDVESKIYLNQNGFMVLNRPRFLAEQLYLFNDAKLLGVSSSYTFNENLKLKMYGFALADQQKTIQSGELSFLSLGQNQISFMDRNQSNLNPQHQNFATILDYYWHNKNSLNLKIQYTNEIKDFQKFVISNNISQNDSLNGTGSSRTLLKSLFANYVHKISLKSALLVNLKYQEDSDNSEVEFSSFRIGKWFSEKPLAGLQKATQKLFSQNKENLASIQYKTHVGKYFYQATFSGISQVRLINTLGYIVGQKPNTALKQSYSLSLNKLNIEQKIGTKLGKLSIDFNLNAGLHFWSLKDSSAQIKLEKNPLLLKHGLSLGYKTGDFSSIFGLWTSENKLPSLGQVGIEARLIDYSTLQEGSNNLNIIKSDNFMLGYGTMNLWQILQLKLQLSYSRETNPYLTEVSVDNLYFRQKYFASDVSTNTYTFYAEIDKTLANLPIKFGLNTNLNQGQNYFKFSSSPVIQSIWIRNLEQKLLIGTALDRAFNIDFVLNISKSELLNQNVGPSVMYNPQIVIRLYKKVSPINFFASIKQYNWKNETQSSVANLLNFSLSYTPPKSNWSYDLEGTNLLNNSQFEIQNLTTISFSRQSYALQPAIIRATAKLNFN